MDFELDVALGRYVDSAICVVLLEKSQALFFLVRAQSDPGLRQEIPYSYNCGHLNREAGS